MQAPEWWYGISGAFFLIGLLFYLALIFLLVQLISMIRDLSAKVDGLSNKMNQMSEHMVGLVGDVRKSTQVIGTNTSEFTSNLSAITRGVATQAEWLTTALVIASGVIKLIRSRRR